MLLRFGAHVWPLALFADFAVARHACCWIYVLAATLLSWCMVRYVRVLVSSARTWRRKLNAPKGNCFLHLPPFIRVFFHIMGMTGFLSMPSAPPKRAIWVAGVISAWEDTVEALCFARSRKNLFSAKVLVPHKPSKYDFLCEKQPVGSSHVLFSSYVSQLTRLQAVDIK